MHFKASIFIIGLYFAQLFSLFRASPPSLYQKCRQSPRDLSYFTEGEQLHKRTITSLSKYAAGRGYFVDGASCSNDIIQCYTFLALSSVFQYLLTEGKRCSREAYFTAKRRKFHKFTSMCLEAFDKYGGRRATS